LGRERIWPELGIKHMMTLTKEEWIVSARGFPSGWRRKKEMAER
jgi:hypothetical protein